MKKEQEHKGISPEGALQSAAQMERSEVHFRKTHADGPGNTEAAVRDDANWIAERTGADPDKVYASLVKRFAPERDDGDETPDALLDALFADADE